MYLDLGAENGGFPINISEEGMAFQGIRPLQKDQQISITFKLDGIPEPVTATARVVWLTDSRKAGALRFVDLPEASRRLIRDWIELQKKAESPQHSAEMKITPFKAKMTPLAPILASIPVPSAAPSKAGTKTNTAASRPPSSSPTLVPSSPTSAPNALKPANEPDQLARVNPTSVVAKAEAQAKQSTPPKAAPASGNLQRAPRIATPPALRKSKSGHFFYIAIGLAALLAMAIACAVLLWPYRSTMRNLSKRRNSANSASPSKAASSLPVQENPAVAPSSDLPMKDPAQWSPFFNPLVAPVAVSQAEVSRNARGNRTDIPAHAMPPLNHAKAPKAAAAPVFASGGMKPRTLAVAPAKGSTPFAEAPPAAFLEGGNGLPAGARAKPALLETKAPPSPIPATGSVEIISDSHARRVAAADLSAGDQPSNWSPEVQS
jgi:hypothetical protein